MVEIEVVDIRKSMTDGNLRAYADVKVGGNLVIKGFMVMNGRKGVFVSNPRKSGKDGKWFDIVTIDGLMRKEIEDKVLEAYDRETDGVRS